VNAANVTPRVADGIVSLSGTVESLRAKRAAEASARTTVGVRSVDNYIKVRPKVQRQDEAIEKEIRGAFQRDPFVDLYEVGVSVYNGVAYLTGSVDSRYEKRQADDLAAGVNGVTRVTNALSIEGFDRPFAYDPYVDGADYYDYGWIVYDGSYLSKSDRQIRDDIDNQLFWSPFVDANQVQVDVEGGIATLTGTVDSWSERESAEENAYEGGALWVKNRLTVEGPEDMDTLDPLDG
jgi:osmotically-inducible protein OsmY